MTRTRLIGRPYRPRPRPRRWDPPQVDYATAMRLVAEAAARQASGLALH